MIRRSPSARPRVRASVRVLGLSLALVAIASACGTKVAIEAEGPAVASDAEGEGDASTDSATSTGDVGPADPGPGGDETDRPITSTPAPDDGSDGSGTPAELASAMHPLYLSLSVHVEGWKDEAANRAGFERHRDALLDLARTAADHGVAISFELGPVFVEAVDNHADPVVGELLALGHGIGVHADTGGRGTLPVRVFRTELSEQRRAVEALVGAPVTHVSGICSQGPWVEAAALAGFTSTNGGVAYCMASLSSEHLPAGAAFVADCAGPADCHGPMVVTDDQRLYPFRVDSSEDFLSDPTAGSGGPSVVLLVGESGSSIDCLAERETGAGCVAAADDIAIAVETVDRYLEAHDDPARVPSLSWSWSIGSLPPEGWSASLFAAFADHVADGSIAWVATDAVGRLADAALPAG